MDPDGETEGVGLTVGVFFAELLTVSAVCTDEVSTNGLTAHEYGNPAEVLAVLEEDLYEHRQGHREEHACRSPNVTPKDERHEYDEGRKT